MWKAVLALIMMIMPATAQELRIITPSNDDSYTINARILGKYLTKYLPEHPNVILQAVPGAASVTAANYLYHVAANDGSTIGIVYKEIPLVGMIGGEGIKFDRTKFNWIGSVADGRKDAIMLWSNQSEFRDNLIVGSEGVTPGNVALFIDKLAGYNFKHVTGYPTTGANRLALERKEVEAVVYNLIGIKAQKPQWLDTNSGIKPLMQMGNGNIRHPDFPNVPTVAEQLKTEEQIKFLRAYESQLILLRPFIAPPGVPETRVKELRKAFMDAVSDPEYLQDAKKANIEVTPISGDEAQAIINLTSDTNVGIINMLRQTYNVK